MEATLTPVKESDEEASFEAVADSKSQWGQSQYNKEQCLKSDSTLSIKPISEESSLLKYKCSLPNCETCRKRTSNVLSDETNSHLTDAKGSIVESQSIEKGDAQVGGLSKPRSNQTDTVNQKKQGRVKENKEMGSASSVSKGTSTDKKTAKRGTGAKQEIGLPNNSELRAEARLKKGQEYAVKTSDMLQRMETKYKSTGHKNFASLQPQNTPVIQDVYPTKEDGGDHLLKKCKVTTAHSRNPFSFPSKKKMSARQLDPPKSGRVRRGGKEITDVEATLKTPRKASDSSESGLKNRKGKSDDPKSTLAKESDAISSSNENIPGTSIESEIEKLTFGFDNDIDNKEEVQHEIDTVTSHNRQAAINEGLAEMVIIDFPAEFADSNRSIHNDTENRRSNETSKADDDESGSGSENGSSSWKTDPENSSQDRQNNDELMDLNGNVTKKGYRFKIMIPSTSESSTDHSISSMSDKSSLSFSHKPSNLPNHETSLSSGSSLQTALQTMFEFEFDEHDSSRKTTSVVLENMESSSDDDMSYEETSSFVMIPSNHEQEGYNAFASFEINDRISLVKESANRSIHDSLESETSQSPSSFTNFPLSLVELTPKNIFSTIADRPMSSKAWEDDVPGANGTSVNNETDSVPFERYQRPTGQDINDNEEHTLNVNGEDGPPLEERPDGSIPTVLTKEAVLKHNLLHNKHLDVVRDIEEPHYKDEDRAHMESRLSSATATTDFSIVTDSTLTVDVDNSEFIGLKTGKVLGHGAYGTVFEGLTADGKLIAVKQVELTISNREIANKEYQHVQCEVKLLRTLQHKNIVRLLGTNFDGASVRILMEHVPGGSIKSLLTQYGALEERIFRKYTKQILEGLVYLHSSGVVHRDIKGSNVMLMTNGTIKLIDFGCAKRLRESALLRESTESRDAKLLKTMLGTPYWMAPEVITSQGHGPKSDIWSVGATVYEMATTHPPLKNLEEPAAMFHIGMGNDMPELSRPKFSRSVINFVKKCFTRDQYQRPSASELLNHRFMTRQKVSYSQARKSNLCS